jgi:hypothetical protein
VARIDQERGAAKAAEMPEEVRGATDALKITWSIFWRPFRFDRYEDPARIPEGRGYVVTGLIIFMATFVAVRWISGQSDVIDQHARSSAGRAYGTLDFHMDPKGIDLDSILIVTGVVIAAAIVGRLIHLFLSRLGRRRASPHLATLACMYWIGFGCFMISIFQAALYGFMRVVGSGNLGDSVIGTLGIVLLVIFFMYAFIVWWLLMFEWPRRLYAIRALPFYGSLVLLLIITGALSTFFG